MTISVVCPHCESRFQLSQELIGKAMRCPNADCREIFEVHEDAAVQVVTPPEPIDAASVPEPAVLDAEPMEALLPVIEGERVLPSIAESLPRPAKSHFQDEVVIRKPKPIEPPVLKATPILPASKLPVPSAPLLPIEVESTLPVASILPALREVEWDGDAAPPELPPSNPSLDLERRPDRKPKFDPLDEIPIRSRPRKNNLPKIILSGLVITLLLAGGGIAGLFLYQASKLEEQLARDAETNYTEGKYGEARKKYDDLVSKYPDSKDRAKYHFFAQLSGVKAAVTAVTTKENPAPALDGLKQFLNENAESPFVQPANYGSDIVQVGQQLCHALADGATDRVRAFQKDRKKASELMAAEMAVAEGQALIPVLEKYRGKTGQSFDEILSKFEKATAEVARERKRIIDIDPWREVAKDPTDRTIEQFERAMKDAGLAKDDEVLAMVVEAKKVLREKVEFTRDQIEPDAAPRVFNAVTAFAPRIQDTPNPKPSPEGEADAVFAVGRGVLYVADAHTGQLLWADRVSTDSRSADTPLRFQSADKTADWLIVPTLLDGVAGLTARDTRTGRPFWHQSLSAAVIGRPVLIGSRLFVALKDDIGTVVQLDVLTGNVITRGAIRQPIDDHSGLTTFRGVRSSHGFLIVPADARRVFVFEVGKEGEDQRVLPPFVVRVIATDHPKGSLRGEPLAIDPDDPETPRRLIVTQTDLPTTMKLRSFELPDLPGLSVPLPGEEAPKMVAEAPVAGWSWFPPVSDGERVAVATDAGTFAVFGLNQSGNVDRPLFQLPGKSDNADQNSSFRGLVVSADEDEYWVVTKGHLTRLKVATDPTGGFQLLPQTDAYPVGEPIARGQIRSQLNLGFLTVKANDSATVHLIAFDLTSGEVRWRRQLGAVAIASPIPQPNGPIIVDECAGIYRLANKIDSDGVSLEPLAAPLSAVTFPARLATSTDGKVLWVMAGDPDTTGQKLLVRKLESGKPAGEMRLLIPAPLAGTPATLGESLLLPLANGYVYRLNMGDATPSQGPAWRGTDAKPDSVCYLTTTGANEFLATDGDRRVHRWNWVSGQMMAERGGGPWEANELITAAPQLLSTGVVAYLIVGELGGVSAFEMGKPTTEHVRRWRGSKEHGVAPGRITHLLVVGTRAIASIEGKSLIGIDPTADNPVWGVASGPAVEAGDVMGLIPSDDSVLVTYQAGQVRQYRSIDGSIIGEADRVSGSPLVPVAAGYGRGSNNLLVPNTDGTVSVVTLVPRR